MGKEFFRRPLMVAGATGGSTVSAFDDVRIAGTLAVAGAQTNSGAVVMPTESLTGSTALQSLSTKFASFITQGTSGSGRGFRLPAPRAGLMKFIAVSANTTSPPDVDIQCNTTAQTFFGSTFNTAAPGNSTVRSKYFSLLLCGVSTSQWAVLSGSTTFWTFTASTGSTGQ